MPDSLCSCPGWHPTVLARCSQVRRHTCLTTDCFFLSWPSSQCCPFLKIPCICEILFLKRSISHLVSYEAAPPLFPWAPSLLNPPYVFVEYILERVLWEFQKLPNSKTTFIPHNTFDTINAISVWNMCIYIYMNVYVIFAACPHPLF